MSSPRAAPVIPPRRSEHTARVVIIRREIPDYRRPFYEALWQRLRGHGVELVVASGGSASSAVAGAATPPLAWSTRLRMRRLPLGRGRRLLWQSGALALARAADLVIVEQATSLLENYPIMVAAQLGGPRVAFWGHGRNFQAGTASGAGETVKRAMSQRVHWWFAYNDLSSRVVSRLGFPQERITSVHNAIDTSALVAAREALDPSAVERARDELGLAGRHVGIYCGRLYAEKRVPVLLEAAHHIRREIPDFELIVIGDGPDAATVDEAARATPWIHAVGAKRGLDRVPLFALADVFLLPGLVGLAVLDSFALEVPLVTSATGEHSPEIDYLEHGVNGIIVDDGGDPRRYAVAVVDLLGDTDRLAALRDGGRVATRRYTIEHMADRFADGVLAALAAPRRPRPLVGVSTRRRVR